MSRQQMLGNMIDLATQFHTGQFDLGGKPYILHPLTVMQLLSSDDEELNCIAVGHGLFKDTACTVKDLLNAGQSERVIVGITCMTRWPGQSESVYREQVKSSIDAVQVKRRDLIHNSCLTRLKGVAEKDMARAARYVEFYTELESITKV